MKKIFLAGISIPAFALLIWGVSAQSAFADRLAVPGNTISIEVPGGWSVFFSSRLQEALRELPNPTLSTVGADPNREGLILLKSDGAEDLIPHVQITAHKLSGLGLSEGDLENLNNELQEIYSRKMGTPFRMFVLEEGSVAGLRCVKLTGIYRWRTVNMKVLQHLIPGRKNLYSVTYTAKEREFNRYLPEVEAMLSTVKIPDKPVFLDRLWSFLRWILLIGIVGGILWGIVHINSIRPEKYKTRYRGKGKPGTRHGDREDIAPNPFMRKK